MTATIKFYIPQPVFIKQRVVDVKWGVITASIADQSQDQIFNIYDENWNYRPEYAHVLAIGRVISAYSNQVKLDIDIDNTIIESDDEHWHGAILLADYLFHNRIFNDNEEISIVALGKLNCAETNDVNHERILPKLYCSKAITAWIISGGLSAAIQKAQRESYFDHPDDVFLPSLCQISFSSDLTQMLWPIPSFINIQKLYFPVTSALPQTFISYSKDFEPHQQGWLHLESSTGYTDDFSNMIQYAKKYWLRLNRYHCPSYLWLERNVQSQISGDSYQLALALILNIAIGLDFHTQKYYFLSGKVDYRNNKVSPVSYCANKLRQIESFIMAQQINRNNVKVFMPELNQDQALRTIINELDFTEIVDFISTLPDHR